MSTTARSKRMLDVQFVSELMQVAIKNSLSGFDQNALDDIYADYDDLADVLDFSEDDFRTRFEKAKDYVRVCPGSFSAVTKPSDHHPDGCPA